jgi:hypothetical protein
MSVRLCKKGTVDMSDKEFALLTVIVSGVFALLVSLVTHFLSASRESRTLKREIRRDQKRGLRELYEEAIFTLDRTCSTLGKGTDDDRDKVLKFLARLHLHATTEIRDEYLKTADVVDSWAAQARKGEPKPVGEGFLMIGSPQFAERAKAQSMWPQVETHLEQLKKLMRKHLETTSEF